jgi:hypothetical protein
VDRQPGKEVITDSHSRKQSETPVSVWIITLYYYHCVTVLRLSRRITLRCGNRGTPLQRRRRSDRGDRGASA